MIINLNIQKTYTTIECYKCGVIFAISNTLDNGYRENKQSFYCPNGHSQAYVKSTAEKLQEQLDQKDKQLTEMNDKIYSLQSELNQKNKTRKKRPAK